MLLKMEQFSLSTQIDPNKIFLVNRSELEGRIDPEMVLYNRETRHFNFKAVTLKNLLKKAPQYGANETGIERNSQTEPRYIRITDIDEYGLLKSSIGVTAERIEQKYLLDSNDILFARSGATVGKAYLHNKKNINYECFFAGYMIRFVVKEDVILSKYLFTYTQLKPYKNWVKSIQRVAGQPNINAEEYKSLMIPLPQIEIQQKIVDIFERAYLLKQQKEAEARALLESIDGYLMAELGIKLPEQDNSLRNRIFTTKFSEVTGDRLDSYYYKNDFLKLEQQLYESKYSLVPFREIIKSLTNGFDFRDYKEEGFPYIKVANVKKGEFDFSKIQYIDLNYSEIEKKIQLKKGNLLLTRKGTFGNALSLNQDYNYIISSEVFYIELKQDLIDSGYLEFSFNSTLGQSQFDRVKIGAIMGSLSQEALKSLKILLPPIDKQKGIAVHIQSLRTQAKGLLEEAVKVLEEAKREVERMIIGE